MKSPRFNSVRLPHLELWLAPLAHGLATGANRGANRGINHKYGDVFGVSKLSCALVRRSCCAEEMRAKQASRCESASQPVLQNRLEMR